MNKKSFYVNLGAVYYALGDFSKALEYYRKSLNISKKLEDRIAESSCYGNIGIVYYHHCQLTEAIRMSS